MKTTDMDAINSRMQDVFLMNLLEKYLRAGEHMELQAVHRVHDRAIQAVFKDNRSVTLTLFGPGRGGGR